LNLTELEIHHLLTIPFEAPAGAASSDSGTYNVEYVPYRPKDAGLSPAFFSNAEIQKLFSIHKFTDSSHFVPGSLEIRGLSQADIDLRRIVVLSKDKHHYQVFAFRNNKCDAAGNTTAEDEDVSMSSDS
jgi:hypothetical protein